MLRWQSLQVNLSIIEENKMSNKNEIKGIKLTLLPFLNEIKALKYLLMPLLVIFTMPISLFNSAKCRLIGC